MSRSEAKSRRAMQKLGLKAVAGVSRVTIRKSKQVKQGGEERGHRGEAHRRLCARAAGAQRGGGAGKGGGGCRRGLFASPSLKPPTPGGRRRPRRNKPKHTKQLTFVIEPADVFRLGDTFVIFGEAKSDDAAAQQQAALAQQFSMAGMGGGAMGGAMGAMAGAMGSWSSGTGGAGGASTSGAAAVVEEEEDEAEEGEGGAGADEAGVEAKDVELVMTQASVSRARAVKALKASGGDIVSAIMELTA